MRRAVASFAVASVLLAAVPAFAEDPPPPPPPPPAESGSTSSGSSGGSAFRAADALLDASTGKKRPMMLSFFAGIDWGYYGSCFGYYGYCGFPLSLGARFNIPLVHDGFLPMLNDSFDLEFGVDTNFYFASQFGFGLLPMIEPRWNFYLLPNLTAYVKLAIGIGIYPGSAWPVRFQPNGAVGILFKLGDKIFLRAEVGYWSLKGGIGIAF